MSRLIGARMRSPLTRLVDGTTTIEVLMSLTILSASFVPILSVVGRNLDVTRVDRARLLALSLCRNTLERFRNGGEDLTGFLTPSSTDPDVLEGRDIWSRCVPLRKALGIDSSESRMATTDMHLFVRFRQNMVPGMNELVCKVTWIPDCDHPTRKSDVTCARLIAYEHLH